MSIVPGVDVIGANIGAIPAWAKMVGSYTTGSGPVPAPASFWAKYPHAIRICQDPGATDDTADVLDVESGAARNSDAAGWVTRARAAIKAGKRHGQRPPAVYTSASNVTPAVNAMINGGVHGGVGLWIASWGIGQAAAIADVEHSSGPWPVIGLQFKSDAAYDEDVWSSSWLGGGSAPPPPGPPGVRRADGKTSLGAYAAGRGYADVFTWLDHQKVLNSADAEALTARSVPPAGTIWHVNP